MKIALVIVALLLASQARCQATIQVDAGGGDLLSGGAFAEGISVTTYFPNNTIYTGLAVRDGHFIVGAADTFMLRDFKTTVGDQMIGLNTGNVGLGLALKGVSIHRERQLTCSDSPRPALSRLPGYGGWHCEGGWSLTAFTGATGTGVFLPFQQYARAQHFGAGILAQQKFKHFEISGLGVLEGGQRTFIGAAEYHFRENLQVTGSTGWLNSQRYLQAFASVRPLGFISFYGNHSSFFEPFPVQGNSVGTALTAGRFTAQGTLNDSSSLGIRVHGENVGAGLRVGFVSGQSNWYKSNGQTFLTHSITENLSRFSFTETISQAAGRNSFAFGGGYHSSRVSISVNHSVQFLLGGQGYTQVLGVAVSFKIHDTSLNAGTITNPTTGKSLWSVNGENYIQAGGLQFPGPQSASGKHLFSGVIQDENGKPVAGACLKVGKQIVYSNDQGAWELRSRINRPQQVVVLTDEFQLGTWRVVSAPVEAKPGESIVITVVRL